MEKELIEGVMWEDNPFIIKTNAECSSFGGEPCRHCHSFKKKENSSQTIWINPAIVIVRNEGGYNSTELCIQCLEEAIAIVRSESK